MMTNKDVLSIPNPSERVLLYTLETFPCQVPYGQEAHVTLYAAGIYHGAPRPPTDIGYDTVQAFLEGCDQGGYQPTQVTVWFDLRRKLFLPSKIELLIDPQKIEDGLAKWLTNSLRSAGRPFSTIINLSGYHPTTGDFNYDALTKFRNQPHQTETIGELFVPLDTTQTGPHRGDDSPANALEYYERDLMVRNEHGTQPLSEEAIAYFRAIQRKFAPDEIPIPF